MKTYNVTIQATVTKTYTVEAKSKDEAYNEAHEFSPLYDGSEEYYDEQTLWIEEAAPLAHS